MMLFHHSIARIFLVCYAAFQTQPCSILYPTHPPWVRMNSILGHIPWVGIVMGQLHDIPLAPTKLYIQSASVFASLVPYVVPSEY
jgi:hypothetical protein